MRTKFREVALEKRCIEDYFDGDYYNEMSGDYCNTLFLITSERGGYYNGLNAAEYKRIKNIASEVCEYIENDCDVICKNLLIDGFEIKSDEPLKEWAERIKYYPEYYEDIAEFLSIVTGKPWDTMRVYGYCQGDIVTAIYCTETYDKPEVRKASSILLGCCKEFIQIEYDDDGNEMHSYGCFVADSEIAHDEDYKRIIAEEYEINEEEVEVELIENSYYKYKAI